MLGEWDNDRQDQPASTQLSSASGAVDPEGHSVGADQLVGVCQDVYIYAV